MIPQETVDLILDTARIEEVVGDFLTLKRRGASLVACCPFHNEKTPSFNVTPAKGIFKCFGCGKAGDAVRFLMEHEHMTYPEALRYLAAKYHIEIHEKDETPEDIQNRQRRESLVIASEFVQKFFVDSLQTDEGRAMGQAYYRSRGILPETIERFGLGWAPKSNSLTSAAKAAGFNLDYLVDIGALNRREEDGSVYDRFRERVMFPIHSLSGHVIAYSGRTLRSDCKEAGIAKYVNTSETELYHKSNALYGIYLAKGEISKKDRCYLLEGNIDVVTMSQLGIRNVVASCGTALTVEQIRVISKFTRNITIMYDGDAAGVHAALRGIGMVLAEGMNVRVVMFPDGDDPDSFARKHTLEEVEAFIATEEKDFVDFMADRLLGSAGRDPMKRAEAIGEIADTISLIPDPLKRNVYVQTISAKFDISEDVLSQRVVADRRKQADEESKRKEREERRAAAGLNPEGPDAPQAPAREKSTEQLTMEALEVNKTVAQNEKELLMYLLRYGTEVLEFPSDSEYYIDEENKLTVAEFIAEAIDSDGGAFINPAFDKTYQEYLSLYDQGFEPDTIVRRLAGSQDSEVSFVAAQLAEEKYELTVARFSAALMNISSWLVNNVPRAILQYNERKVESQRLELLEQMSKNPVANTTELMQKVLQLQKIQKVVNKKIAAAKQIIR